MPKSIRPYQRRLLTEARRVRDLVVVSCPQVGKSWAAGLSLLVDAWLHGRDPFGRPWWLLAPTYAQVLQLQRTVVMMADNAGILAKVTQSPPVPTIELEGGGRIECRSWNDPDNLRGTPLLGGVGDEFGMLTADAYRNITARRAETVIHGMGRMIWIGNVGVIGGEAERLWNMAEQGAAGFEAMRWTWRDRAEALACSCSAPCEYEDAGDHELGCERGTYLEFIATEAERLPGSRFRADYEAEWLDAADLPVYEFDREVHVNAEYAKFHPELPLEISCDFNVDPMCWTLGQHKGDEIWTFDEIAIPGGATTRAACEEIIRRYPNRKLQLKIYGDASGKARTTRSLHSDYDIIRQILGGYYLQVQIHVPAANPPVMDRVNSVNAKLRSASGTVRYWVHPNCTQLIEDRVRVSFKPGTRDIDKSNRQRTHASDADDYRIVELYPLRAEAPISVGVPEFGYAPVDSIATMEF